MLSLVVFSADNIESLWAAFLIGPPLLAIILGVGLWISGPVEQQDEEPLGFWAGFYMVRQERPRWPISLGNMVEVLPPYRRGHGIVVWWFRQQREDEHDWGWIPLDAIQIGWGRCRTIGTWVPEEIASWQPPEDEDGQVLGAEEDPAEAPTFGSAL